MKPASDYINDHNDHSNHERTVTSRQRMIVAIGRLFDENPSPLGADQVPALECVVLLRGSPQATQGALSKTDDGGLKMLSVIASGPTEKDCVEQYFDYEDVMMIGVLRKVSVRDKTSSIFAV